jgi:MFS family permease
VAARAAGPGPGHDAAPAAVAAAGRSRRRDAAGGLVFYVLIVQLSFRLDSIGVESTATIGAASAIASLGTAIGAFLFGRLAPLGPAVTVPLAFGLSGVGIVGMGLASTVPLVVAAAVVTGFGNGLLLPSLLTWALGSLGFEQRGRGTGVWTSALFIGQFACPLVVLALSGAIGGLGSALVVVGAVSLAAAAGVRAIRPVQTVEPAVAAH